MSQQSKLGSAIESICNVGSGMVLAYCTTQFILCPLLSIPISAKDNVVMTIVLTVLSVLRSYLWRRYFNHRAHKNHDK